MAAVISISIITVLATALLALFEPRLHPKRPSLRIYWAAPLAGALLLLLFTPLSFIGVGKGLLADSAVNPIKILVLFLSMTLLSIFLDEAGFFRYLASAVMRRAGHSQKKLFLLLYLVVSVLTVFTSNDIVILTFTPFICYFSKHAKIDPVPYLIAEFVAANTWSMALIIGNPTNIYLAAGNGINFATYFGVMAFPTILSGGISLLMLWLLFGRKLSAPIAVDEESEHLQDKPTVMLGVAALGGCIMVLVLSSYLDISMWLVAFVACIALYAFAIPELLMRHRGLGVVVRSVKRAPFDVIPFVISMFAMVFALDMVGATDMIGRLVLGEGEIWRCGVASFLFANLMNNIPMSVLFSTVVSIEHLPALYAAVIGSNVGAFFTPMGALAGIMFMTLLHQHGVSLSFGRFIKYGTLLSVPSLLAALLGLAMML